MTYEDAIVRYEIARKLVSNLKEKNKALIYGCDNLKCQEGESWEDVVDRKPCLVMAWDWMVSENKGEPYYNQIDYDEVLHAGQGDFDIGTISNGVCNKCREAHAIKRGELAEAKKEFGAAKRSLSAIGKKLMKGSKL